MAGCDDVRVWHGAPVRSGVLSGSARLGALVSGQARLLLALVRYGYRNYFTVARFAVEWCGMVVAGQSSVRQVALRFGRVVLGMDTAIIVSCMVRLAVVVFGQAESVMLRHGSLRHGGVRKAWIPQLCFSR